MKKMESIRVTRLSVVLGIMSLATSWVYGETTVTDSYYIAGKVRPIIAIQAGDRDHWTKPPFVMLLGLERIPGSKKPGIYGYRLVLDTSMMEGVLSTSCVQRFERSWDSIREHFPVWPDETKREHPPEDSLWKSQRDAQRFEFSSQGCSVRLWVGNVSPYGNTQLINGTPALGAHYPGLSGKEFTSLFFNKVINVNRGKLEFTAKNQKFEINFLVHHEDISNLRYVPAPAADQTTQIARIDQRFSGIGAIPQYAYETGSFSSAVATLWMDLSAPMTGAADSRQQYEQFYFAAIEYRAAAIRALADARRLSNNGATAVADRRISEADRLVRLSHLSADGATQTYQGNLGAASELARGIREGSRLALEFGAQVGLPKAVSPVGTAMVDVLFLATDNYVDSAELGQSDAARNLKVRVVTLALMQLVPAFEGQSLSDAISKQTTGAIGSSKLFAVLADGLRNTATRTAVLSFLAKSGAFATGQLSDKFIDALIHALLDDGTASNFLYAMRIGSLWGFVDESGNVVVPFHFDRISTLQDLLPPGFPGQDFLEEDFFVGKLLAVRKNGKWGFVDRRGVSIISPRFDGVGSCLVGGNPITVDCFANGLAAIQQGVKWGYIDPSGSVVITPKFDYAGDFQEGGVAVVKLGDRVGVIDRSGRYVMNPVYSFIDISPRGIIEATEWTTARTAIYNTNGQKTAEEPAWHIGGMVADGMRSLTLANGRSGVVELATGRIVVPFEFDAIGTFSEGLAAARKGHQSGYIDRSASFVFVAQFDSGGEFHEGLAWINRDGKLGFVDRTGTERIALRFDAARDFSDGRAWVSLGSKQGYIDTSGHFVVPAMFDRISSYFGNLARARYQGNWVLVDRAGKIVFTLRPK